MEPTAKNPDPHHIFIDEVQGHQRRWLKVIQFTSSSTKAAAIMLAAAIVALVIANSPFFEPFEEFWHTHVVVGVGGFIGEMSLAHIINDIFMAIFFLLVGLEVVIINRGRSDRTPLPADAVIVLGAGVNGTEPSLSLRTRLDAALDYLETCPDIPAVLTGGTGYGEEISEAACMYDYLTERGVEPDRLILEDQASNTAENFALSRPLLEEAGVDPAESRVAVVTNDFHMARSELIAARQGYGDVAGVPAPLPWAHLTVNYYLREAFALVKTFLFD